MVVAASCCGGATQQQAGPGRHVKTEPKMNALKYGEILEENLMQSG